ncbi:hypothetical protein FSP39_006879 [Pinctada imbricata]|uniref:CCHC-type domain-containing protein n=1 Tax=Pinctada imbricata TaxID=66713 RepID=A0AA88YSF7_PINIB|nr:hypothetical protein FSP39_006879 [Pinctada imbricata]
MQIGKYRALVLHYGQPDERKECSNCLQKGHNTRDCTSDIVCRSCHAPGHVSSDCPIPLIDDPEESESDTHSEKADQTEEVAPNESTVASTSEHELQTDTHVPQGSVSQPAKLTNTASDPSKTKKSNATQHGKSTKTTITQFFKDTGTPQRKSSNIPHHVRSPPTPTEQIQSAAGKKPKEHKSKSK